MEILIISIIIILCIPSIPLIIWMQLRGHIKNFKKAEFLEKQGKYKEAIYSYATTILTGTFKKKLCASKIRELSQKYGPFQYDDILKKELEEQGGETPEQCSRAGHEITVGIIKEAINNKI